MQPEQDQGVDELVLYNTSTSTCSQKVRLALEEKEIPFRERKVSLIDNEHLQDWYLQLNPNGVVPTLVHGTAVVTDSSVINEYLEEVFPERPLMPRDPASRARMRAWRQYIDEVPTAAIRVPSFNRYILKGWDYLSDDSFNALVEKRTVRKQIYTKMGRTGFDEAEVQSSWERLRQTAERMSESLKSGPWLMGDQFTLADVSLVPTFVRMEHLGMKDVWIDLPRVVEWYSNIRDRPSFSRAFYEGSLPKLP